MGFAFWVHVIGICGELDYDKSTFARYEEEIRGVLATALWLDPNMHLDY